MIFLMTLDSNMFHSITDLIVDNDVNILYTPMVAGSYTETWWNNLLLHTVFKRIFKSLEYLKRCTLCFHAQIYKDRYIVHDSDYFQLIRIIFHAPVVTVVCLKMKTITITHDEELNSQRSNTWYCLHTKR